ncbi:MAG: hypothetical protein ABI835_17875, partial [Chloroflexota bacterium]
MKNFCKAFLLFCCLFALPLIASAQESQTVDLGDGYVIIVPDDWQVTQDDPGAFTLEGDETTLIVLTPRGLEDIGLNFSANNTVNEVLSAITVVFEGSEPEAGEVEKLRIDDRAAASISFPND